MNKGKLANYFENKYLDYQKLHGRMSLAEFASVLKISRGFLSQLLAGTATSMKYQTALMIADVCQDYDIFDILGYDRPDDPFPEVSSALESARQKIISSGLAWNSPEAQSLLIEAMKDAGYTLTRIEDDESAK